MKHINLTQMLQGCSKRNGMTVSASGSDGAQTSEVKRQTLSSKKEKWSKNGALSSTCLRSASVPLSFRSRYLRYAAMIFCVLAMSIANIGMAWGATQTVGYTTHIVTSSKTGTGRNIKQVTGLTVTALTSSDTYMPAYATGDKDMGNKIYGYNTCQSSKTSRYAMDCYNWKVGTQTGYAATNTFWTGFKVKVASGKKFSLSSANMRLLVNYNHTWRLAIEDSVSGARLATSSDYTITNYNACITNDSLVMSLSDTTACQDLTGTFYVKMYFAASASATGKYFCFPTLTVTGDLEDAAASDTYYLCSDFSGEWTETQEITPGSYVDVSLPEASYLKYKIKKVPSVGDATWYGRDGSADMERANCIGWTLSSSGSDCYVRTDIAGTYRFAMSLNGSGVPVMTVTYPTGVAVTLNMNGGGDPDTWQAYTDGVIPVPPYSPGGRDGYAFDGWYEDAEGSEPWHWGTTVNSATTLYAKWSHAWYFRGSADWSAYHLMSRSTLGSYWYYACSKGTSHNEFLVHCNGSNYGNVYNSPEYMCTNISDMNSSGNNWGHGDNSAIYEEGSDYYVLVFPPHTAANTTDAPKICAHKSLPEEFYAVESGINIYFDNSEAEWSNIYFRKGRSCHNEASSMTKVTGTDNLYKLTVAADYNGYQAFHIANNRSWTGSNSIYTVNTGDSYKITKATEFQRYQLDEDMTFTPGDEGDLDGTCQYYVGHRTYGMKKDNVSITAPTNGSISVTYTSGSGGTLTSGNADLAHTSILTISATGATGYDLDELTVNEVAHTSGNTYVLSEDAVVAATFTLHDYNVTYSAPSNGNYTIKVADGTASSASMTATYGQTVTLAATPNTGYSFTSWTVTKAGGGTVTVTDNQFSMPADNVTITATFTLNTYTVSFDKNEDSYGTLSASSIASVPHGSEITVNSNQVTINGTTVTATAADQTAQYTYAFSSWSNTTGTVTAARTITANFTRTNRSYTVTLTTNGGTINAGNVTSYTYGAGATLPTDVTKDDYIFDGWYANSGLTGDRVYTIADDATGNKEYWAKWEALPEGCFETNSTTLNSNSKTLADGVTVAFVSDAAKSTYLEHNGTITMTAPSGYAFDTFEYIATSGSDGKTNKYRINGGSDQNLENSTIALKIYEIDLSEVDATTILLIKNGTKQQITNICYTLKSLCSTPDAPDGLTVSAKTTTSATLSISDDADVNNYEIYYSTESDAPEASTVALETTTSKSITISGLTVGTTYYAWVRSVCNEDYKSSWVAASSFSTLHQYTMSYNKGTGDGISGSQSNQTKTEGSSFTLPGVVFTRSGYVQTGWATSDGGSKAYELGGSYTTDAAQTFYPVWGAVYTVTFNTNGTGSVSPITQSTYEGSITMPSGPSSTDSTFLYWVIGGNTYAASASYTPTSNITAYAAWKEKCSGGSTEVYSMTLSGTNGKSDITITQSTADVASISNVLDDSSPMDVGGLKYFKFGSSSSITLTYTFAANDKLVFDICSKDDNKNCGVSVKVGSSDAVNVTGTINQTPSTLEYTITSAGSATILIKRAGDNASSMRLHGISITRSGGSGGTCYYVKYDGNGAESGSINDATAYTSSSNSVTVLGNTGGNAFVRDGYTFNGWNTKANGSGDSKTAGGTFTITKDTVLYAQWTSAVCAAPTITAQTEIQEIDLGERPEFSITATGAGSYQWYTCGADGSGEVVIDGATSRTYSPVAPTVVGTSYYKCKAIASCDASYVTYSDVIPCVVSPTNFTIHYETNTSKSSENYDIAHFTQTKEVNSEVTSYITSLTNFAKTSGITISDAAKEQEKVVTMSGKISVLAAYDENEYLSYTFTVANNYYLSIDSIDIRCQPVGGDNHNFKVVLTDALGTTITGNISTTKSGVLNRIPFTSAELNGKKLVGTVKVKIYGWFTSEDTYRLGRHSYIYGKVSSLPAPTASWTARPASATVGDGGKTYTLTTDGTNTVAWSITDQSGATGATLSEPSVLSTTLSGYTTAGSLYVQAAVTGDGVHYLSTPATLLRQRVVISAGCVETTLISATLSSCTGTGDVTGTPGGSSAVSFESCESIDGGYKMGKDDSYMRLALSSGNFEANDEVKITITKASDQGDGALHIYKYADASWTELGSVTAAGAGTYSYTLTETNVSTAFNTIGLYRTGKNQNPYVKALSVVRSSCSATKPSRVTVTASPAGPSYDIDDALTLTVSADNANTYQWYSNTNNTASDGFLLVGETETTYSPSTTIAGTTYYYCVATNTSGSTVSNIIEVTVNSAKSTPEVSWTDTYETPTYGGGGYAVKATVSDASWDGTLTTDMLTASDGVTLTGVSVSGKVITATYGVTETARSPLSFSLTLPETTNYTALAANKEITFTRCQADPEAVDAVTTLPVLSAYTTVNNIYRWATADAGWFTLETGASSISSESSSYSGFSYRSKSGKKYVLLYSELDAVKAVRLYVNGTGDNTTLSKVRTGTTYNKYKELEESTDYDFTYSNSSTSIASRENAYIEISFKTNLTANTFVEITLSRNTLYYGVELLTGSTEVGTIDTDISWADPAPSATVNKKTTDANFRYEAVKASDAASQATLGTISYKSSVPAVATVSATGVVDILSAGSTRITATLAGSGCYKKATLSYDLVVAAATCTDVAGTITASGEGITIDGNTVTKTDACAAVTLTVSGHTGENDGATYQWYKDGVSMGESYRSKSIPVTAKGDYTVEVTNTGGVHCTMPATNTITITGNAISITKIVDEWYVKNGRRTPDIALATIEGTTSYTVNDGSSDITTFAGCGFELRDGILYLKGQQENGDEPNGLTAGNATLTITAVNACGDEPTATITIHKQVETDKPSIAFIVDGTKGDPVNNVATAKTSSRPIWIYLSEFFDLTGCNAYWTNNEKLIRQYYSQFDAIVITDDPSTDEKPKSGLKYVNALGTMVDVRPILTMEAYVGKYGASSNWHIGGTPSSPNPRQYELKLQCKDHDIFSDLTTSANFRSEEIDGETYYYVTMVDNSVTPYAGLADDAETETYPALQGFSAASIKGTGLLGIGTISDGTLQGGVERQDEPTARMMILGIQHQAMAALTSEGKQVIKNAINYLLKTDMEEVDDCSNYFIGGTLGHEQDWHTASNWSSTKVPDASTKARILVPVTISTKVHVAQVDIAVDGKSIRYDSGNTNCSGSVTIAPTGALIVDGQVRRTTNGRLYTEEELQPTTPADLTIQTSPSAQGALIFDNSDGETQATVVVHSSANKDEGTRNWQYLTSPLQETPVTEFFYGVGTYTYRHCEAEGGWVRYNLGTAFNAFDAIGLTQEDAKDFVFYGPLAPTGEWNLSLTHAHSGNNLFGNSWTAPIDLKALVRNTDFDSNIDKDLAIYNTGTDQKNESGEFDQKEKADNRPGTWHHIPLLLATFEDAGWEGMKVIPAYQAFQLKATAAATLTIDYDKCVRGSESKNYTEPLRSPGHRAAGKSNSDIEALRLAVSDAKGIAYIYLLEGEQFSEEYDNGWELEYKPNSKYGKLYAISPEQGDMMALARPSLEGTMVGFQPGESSEYTITFNETDGYYYLNDLKMEQSTLIQAGESYTFSVEEGESANRFLISSVPFNKPGIVTGVTNPDAEAPKVQKVIYNDKLYIIRGGKVYSADGQLVK